MRPARRIPVSDDRKLGYRRFETPIVTRLCACVVAAGLGASIPVLARADSFPAALDLSTLNSTDGFALDGSDSDTSGFRVSAAGDVNGDGIDDIVIAAPGYGKNYVVFGNDQGFPPRSNLSALSGADGFAVAGAGFEVSGAGDVNGDGLDDVLLGAPWSNKSYVIFGSHDSFPAIFDLTLLDGNNGFAVNRGEFDVSGAGDVNGDGFDDMIIGAPSEGANGVGRAYVVFGSGGGFPPLMDVGALDGSNGFVLEGVDALGAFGFTVSQAGDFNHDGIDDVIVGTSIPGIHTSGDSFIIFGSRQGFEPLLNVSTLNGANGFGVKGTVNNGDYYVSEAGDVNGDGNDDVIIGAPFVPGPGGELWTGQSYVLFGFGGPAPAQFDLSALDGTNGFAMNGFDPGGGAGAAVSGAGDVNGDGIDDVVVGAQEASPNGLLQAGQSYVVFGSDKGFPAQVLLSALDGTNGFTLNGGSAGDYSGISVSSAGDVNADGIGDVMVGAPGASPDGLIYAGQTYVVFGRSTAAALTISGVCPGEVTIKYDGATQNGAVMLFHSSAEGSFLVTKGACAGTVLDLANPLPFAPGAADETGTVLDTFVAPPSACGRFLQIVDETTCATSNVAQLP